MLKANHAMTVGYCCNQLGSGGVISPSAGPGQSLGRDQATRSSEDLAVNCIKNEPKIHLSGAYCLITFRQS